MVFMRNLEKINKHNADPTQTYTMGVNQFADLTQEEFVSRLTLKINATPKVKTDEKVLDLVSDIDWLAAGKVSQTRQGDCGSVWAFPTISVIESALLVAGKPMELLSIQQIIDCSEDYGNEGCTGYIWPTMDFLVDNGIATEK
jgi:C1A family cysteine protease